MVHHSVTDSPVQNLEEEEWETEGRGDGDVMRSRLKWSGLSCWPTKEDLTGLCFQKTNRMIINPCDAQDRAKWRKTNLTEPGNTAIKQRGC